jgi:hypothetical protein
VRLFPALLAVLLVALAVAAPAEAEEVFVLENGVAVRGFVVREDAERILVQLTGFAETNRVTLRTTEVVRRFRSVEGDRLPPEEAAPITDDLDYVRRDPTTLAPDRPVVPAVTEMEPDLDELPGDEPDPQTEGFFVRLNRVTGMSLPRSLEGLLLVGVLLALALAVVVAAGTRVIGMKAPTVHASSTLGLMLGVFVAADIGMHTELLRADRAIWVLPLQAAIWMAVARTALDAPLSRVVPLFAFALFGAACCAFITGSVLVSI